MANLSSAPACLLLLLPLLLLLKHLAVSSVLPEAKDSYILVTPSPLPSHCPFLSLPSLPNILAAAAAAAAASPSRHDSSPSLLSLAPLLLPVPPHSIVMARMPLHPSLITLETFRSPSPGIWLAGNGAGVGEEVDCSLVKVKCGRLSWRRGRDGRRDGGGGGGKV
ncbi:hypothetical protein E2C01_060866 [Portunus trituberculatus]|uniref:Uncharacterized protein n=1 Tax=Portunus trituberculatus TaxID=210409 RepID=A0A5B7HDI3_PORTR|nr:hypothetical protein [Portunus trituberculatus]